MKDPDENAFVWPDAIEREFDELFARMQGSEANAGFKKLLDADSAEIAETTMRRYVRAAKANRRIPGRASSPS